MSYSSSEVDILKNELQVLQHKLGSKCEALLIITQELNTIRNERDQFKSLAEQIQARYGKLKKQMLLQNSATTTGTGSTFAETTSTGFELEDLQMKLQDANETIRMLRNQLSVLQAGKANIERIQLRKEMEESLARTVSPRGSVSEQSAVEERNSSRVNENDVVRQVEALRIENKQLVRDLQVVLEEKEELTIERDSFRARLSRYEVDTAGDFAQHTEVAELRAQIDLSANENRLLANRCRQLESDRSNLLQTLNSYKQLLQTVRSNPAVPNSASKPVNSEPERSSSKAVEEFGVGSTTNSKSRSDASKTGSNAAALDRPFPGLSDGAAFSLRRVKYLIDSANLNILLERPRDSLVELQSLSRQLVEHVQDKQLANVHQRKINKFLAGRLHEYEERERLTTQDEVSPSLSPSPDERASESGSQEPCANDDANANANANEQRGELRRDAALARGDLADSMKRSTNADVDSVACASRSAESEHTHRLPKLKQSVS